MTADQKFALLANIPRLRAEETLYEHGSELTAESLYRLTLLATGDQAAAEDARAKRELKLMREQSIASGGYDRAS